MSEGATLSALFPAAAQAGAQEAGMDLDQTLVQLWEAGRSAWPAVALPPATFVAHLARHAPAGAEVVRWFSAVNAANLYLACGCAQGLAAALLAFDRAILSHVPHFIVRIDPDPAFADDVRQSLRERLLCAEPGAQPRIAAYAGVGALRSFVRVSAVRTALNMRRNLDDQEKEDLDEAAVGALSEGQNPELSFIRRHHQKDFLAAVREAYHGLSPEFRNVLRLRLAVGMSIEQIAATLKLSRATVVRWLARARGDIQRETRRLLQERHGLSSQEVDSLLRLVRGELWVSLTGLLRTSSDP